NLLPGDEREFQMNPDATTSKSSGKAAEGAGSAPDAETFASMQRLSPRRRTTEAHDVPGLVAEQLQHFGIDPASEFGQTLTRVAARLYEAQADLDELWRITIEVIEKLDRSDRIAYFNAKKFLSFQIAKLLDTLQNPFRRSYQGLGYHAGTQSAK